ncbi:MAG: hypothetical protein NC184_01975 [Roseburia sp.]|nr:hypothetical protein [Roseburia sp.]
MPIAQQEKLLKTLSTFNAGTERSFILVAHGNALAGLCRAIPDTGMKRRFLTVGVLRHTARRGTFTAGT